MKFLPLYYRDKLLVINDSAFLGVITLWSRPAKVLEILRAEGIPLGSDSPVAVLGTLYGNGLPQLLRNLLYNPQLTQLLVCGRNRSSSLVELRRFFTHGVEEADFLGVTVHKIRGTRAVMDDLLHPGLFSSPPSIDHIGSLTTAESIAALHAYFRELPKQSPIESRESDRIELPAKEIPIGHFPSLPGGHCIVEQTPSAAWKEVLFKLSRFGRKVELRKGVRKELQNLKVAVLDPTPEPDATLEALGLDPEAFRKYREDMLNAELPPLIEYTYGNRLGAYFGCDTLNLAARRLSEDPENRHQFISLWDTASDFRERKANPCLVTVFFRLSEGKLNLTALYRTHNAIDAWLMNVYGLTAALDKVCALADLPKGNLTVFSHSISMDPSHGMKYEKALQIAASRKHRLREDPHGYFRITVEEDRIVAKHMFNNVTLKEYRGRRAEKIQHQIILDEAVSDTNHAMYIGRQLALAEQALLRGEPFEGDH